MEKAKAASLFSHMQKSGFLMTGLIIIIMAEVQGQLHGYIYNFDDRFPSSRSIDESISMVRSLDGFYKMGSCSPG